MSLKIKLQNLEIERLCKLYAIEGLSLQDEDALYEAILAQIDVKYIKLVESIMFDEIKSLDAINKIAKDENVPEKVITALLRIINTRLIKEPISNKENLQKKLDDSYGEAAAKRTNQLKNNLLKWESITKITDKKSTDKINYDKDIEHLHNSFEYLILKVFSFNS